ncbi:MAG: hypothetical protein A4E35_01520 [Methanoregula sp. PtaU1.Bin051]|nr:MAG: hypothetical protein A4E35_01520 [Methanoregula sp. PtaU1.Bin051]
MKRIILFCAAALIVLFLASAGCTGEKPVEQPTPVPTTPTEAPPPPPATTAMPTPTPTEPVVTLPPRQNVDLELTKDRVYSRIYLLYNGGGGELFTTKIEMRVTRSDGEVTDYVMSGGKTPKRGDQIEADGTRGSDRCEVWVTSAGIRYKVIDRSLIIGGAYEGN